MQEQWLRDSCTLVPNCELARAGGETRRLRSGLSTTLLLLFRRTSSSLFELWAHVIARLHPELLSPGARPSKRSVVSCLRGFASVYSTVRMYFSASNKDRVSPVQPSVGSARVCTNSVRLSVCLSSSLHERARTWLGGVWFEYSKLCARSHLSQG